MEIRRKEIMWIYLTIVFLNVLVLTDGWSVDRDFDEQYLNFRRKRRTNCEEKFATITHGHSACLQRSPSVQDSGVSSDDRQKIIEEHNRLRRKVYPPAKNMREMSWDEGIAITAQKWADNCKIGHDERYKRYDYGRFDVGQNLCWSTYKMNWDEAMSLWSNETKDYQYGSSHGVSAVAHYTQIIWADTSLVGCGYSHCKGTHFYVCNYGPAGNYDISKPYEAGQTCADCPHNCRDKLCDCRGKVCFNGGKMDLKTCTCTCNKDFDFYVPPFCDLNCTGIKEPSYCRKQFGPTTCEIYSNVPQMCPSMCKWCPVAGKKSLVTVHSTDNSENTAKRRYDQMLREKQREDEIKRLKTTHDVNQREDERRKNEHALSTKQRQDTRRQHQEMVPDRNHDDSGRTYKDSDLQRVAGIVQKTLAVNMEPLVHSYVSQVNADIVKRAKELENKNKVLLKEVNHLNRKVTDLEDDLDSVEQYNKRNSLRLSGIPEETSENTDTIVKLVGSAVGIDIQLSDIDRSQRVGKAKRNHQKDIIVKFVSYKARKKLYDARMRLKDTQDFNRVSINEFLTRKRKKLLIGARKLMKSKRISKAWSRDGHVFIEDLKLKRKKISKESDLDKYKRLPSSKKSLKLNKDDNST